MAANPPPTALDQLLVKLVALNGTPLASRQYLNLLTGISAIDNPTFAVNGETVGSTDVSVTVAGVNPLTTDIVPDTDNTRNAGSSVKRLASVVSQYFQVFHAASDLVASTQMGDGYIAWGPGGSSFQDTKLSRTSASVLTLDNAAGGAATLEVPKLGGVAGGTPFTWKQRSIALTSGSNLTLSSTQYDAPLLIFTGTLSGTGTAITLPTESTQHNEWIMNFMGVTFGSYLIQVQVGANTKVLDVNAQHVYRVYSDGVGSLYSTQYA